MMTEAERGIVGAVATIGDRIVSSLPAQFLVLVLLNTAFLVGLLWFLDREQTSRISLEEHQVDARERVLMPLLASCLHEREAK